MFYTVINAAKTQIDIKPIGICSRKIDNITENIKNNLLYVKIITQLK